MRTFSRLVLTCLLLAVLVLPAAVVAQDGTIARMARWEAQPGMTDEFEAGLKAHNALHVEQNDPNPLFTFEILSGDQVGQYLRGSFNHNWADFDDAGENAEADAADSAVNINPYLASTTTIFWRSVSNLSNPADGLKPLARVIFFQLKPGHERAFTAAVGKIHGVLSEMDWPAYEWYSLVDGGYSPTWVVVLPRDNWAGFAPGEKSFFDVVAEALGDEEAAEVFKALGSSTAKQWSHTIAWREDLSYMPASE